MRAGAGEHERQDDDPGGLRASWGRLHRRRRCVAHRGDGLPLGGFTAKAPSTLGTFLRSFRWGHVRQLDRVSRELLARALAGRCRTRRRTIDHRPGLHHLRDLRTGQGGRPPPRLYRCKRGYHPLLAVAAGTGDVLMSRLREGRANTARGAAHFLRETVGRVRYCRGQRTTHGTGRQRVLYSRRGIRLPPDGCPLLHRHPPARPPAESHRGDTRRCLDADSLLDGRCRRCGRDHPPPSRPRRTPRRYGSSSGG